MIPISRLASSNMNTLTVVTFLACIACNMAFKMPDRDSPEAKAAFQACAKENDVDVSAFEKKDPTAAPDFDLMATHKCFFNCLMLKAELVNDKGDFNIDKVKAKFELKDDDDMIKQAKVCATSVKETDPCQRVIQLAKCTHERKSK